MSERGDVSSVDTVPERAAVALVPPPGRGEAASERADGVRPGRWPTWLKGLAPLLAIGVVVAAFLRVGPVGVFRSAFPPLETLTIERVTFPRPNELRVRVVNGGPAQATVAQVLVDQAVWVHTLDGSRVLPRLASRVITVPYPWVAGEPVTVTIVSGTGLTFSSTVEVAAPSPLPDARYLSTFALLGLYAGVIPVFLGLLWGPFLRSVHRKWLDFFLSLTIGLLVFLGVDALDQALRTAARVPGAFQGLSVVLVGVLGAPLALAALGRRRGEGSAKRSPARVSLLIAIGIGLHNLGEGLAIGASYATGQIALGTFLVIGFLLHNTTEGLGILAPLGRERPTVARLAWLGTLAGAPTIAGTWIGGFSYSPVWTTFFFAVGAGAIIQVVAELWRLFARRSETGGLTAPLNAAGLVAGLAIMYATGLLVPA